MPKPRSLMLMQCVGSPGGADDGKWWLAECFLTSDGPRMRVIPCNGMTEDQARAELERREALVAAPDVNEAKRRAFAEGYRQGENSGESRSRNRPGDGDMGG